MDDSVLAAMRRWPNVPAVFGWLRLDPRGRWMLIDRGRPDFDPALHGLGDPITSPQIIAFIERNYAADAQGRWFFQNGPQRVYVTLAVAPWIVRVCKQADQSLHWLSHTGIDLGKAQAAWATTDGQLILQTAQGAALVDDRDLAELDADLIWDNDRLIGLRQGESDPNSTIVVRSADDLPTLSRELGYVACPQPSV